MKTKPLILCTIITAACLATTGAPAFAAEEAHQKHEATHEKSGEMAGKNMDETFAMKAADGGMAEVQLGELAEKNGESQMVKDFGKRMVADHSKANKELKSIAAKKNIMLPEKISAEHQMKVDKLSKLKGAEFDKAYMKEMKKDHQKDIAEFSRASKELKDPDLKQFAEQTLPVLKGHMEMLKSDMAAEHGEHGASAEHAEHADHAAHGAEKK